MCKKYIIQCIPAVFTERLPDIFYSSLTAVCHTAVDQPRLLTSEYKQRFSATSSCHTADICGKREPVKILAKNIKYLTVISDFTYLLKLLLRIIFARLSVLR